MHSVPDFLRGKGQRVAHRGVPDASARQSSASARQRDGRGKAPSGRTQEIQRLVGRALRAALDMRQLGERTITLDCDVLEADGGTRTAFDHRRASSRSALALAGVYASAVSSTSPVLRDSVAAISVGQLEETHALDLVYTEDSTARVDLNLVPPGDLAIVEVARDRRRRGHPAQRSRRADRSGPAGRRFAYEFSAGARLGERRPSALFLPGRWA